MSTATKTPCATTFTFNHVAKTIDGKECDFKRASIPGSDFEALLLSRMEAQPTYTLNPIKINTNPNKKSYAGLNRKLMLDYIATQVDAELRMPEYNKANTTLQRRFRPLWMTRMLCSLVSPCLPAAARPQLSSFCWPI